MRVSPCLSSEICRAVSGVGRESRDGKFPGIPGYFGFPFPGKTWPGSREKEPTKKPQFCMKIYGFFLHEVRVSTKY